MPHHFRDVRVTLLLLGAGPAADDCGSISRGKEVELHDYITAGEDCCAAVSHGVTDAHHTAAHHHFSPTLQSPRRCRHLHR